MGFHVFLWRSLTNRCMIHENDIMYTITVYNLKWALHVLKHRATRVRIVIAFKFQVLGIRGCRLNVQPRWMLTSHLNQRQASLSRIPIALQGFGISWQLTQRINHRRFWRMINLDVTPKIWSNLMIGIPNKKHQICLHCDISSFAPHILNHELLTGQTYKLDCLMALLGWLSHLVGKEHQMVLHHCPIPGRRTGCPVVWVFGILWVVLNAVHEKRWWSYYISADNVNTTFAEESDVCSLYFAGRTRLSTATLHLIVGIRFTGWIPWWRLFEVGGLISNDNILYYESQLGGLAQFKMRTKWDS